MESPPRDFKSLASTIPPLGQQEEFITIAYVGKSDKDKEKPDPLKRIGASYIPMVPRVRFELTTP